ncbi:MAG: NAD(P)/FAD-dependent oxidoreductase [Pseudomonadaceae bacterium]
MNTEHFDVLIVGAGLSGIGTACHIQRAFPNKKLVILERRQQLGGTWDLFRYPGIRSDSDMFSFGYAFRPWNELKVLADGPSIRQYLADTAKQYKIDEKIQYGLKILSAEWSSEQRLWTLEAEEEATGTKRRFTCDFFISCTGYYNHDAGFLPKFPGEEQYKGQRIHPQHWPEDLDYSGKTVLVIGSGATAVTLVPAMAGKAAHVTMLQRSPSYIFSVPGLDKISAVLGRFLPEKWVYNFARTRNIRIQRWLYESCRRWPKTMRSFLLWRTRSQLGKDFDMSHFTPKYMPWDERLCAVPDGDLFKALRNGQASVVTDHIDTFTETGIRLKSGKQLDADIIITATGLNLQMLGGIQLRIDGEPRLLGDSMTYKGLLLQNVPNMAWIIGYTNAPWTLKSDLSGEYLCRLFKYMEEHDLDMVTPRDEENCDTGGGILDSLASGYVQRAKGLLPRQGSKLPWKVTMNFERDSQMLLEDPIEDGILQFERTRMENVTPLRRSA